MIAGVLWALILGLGIGYALWRSFGADVFERRGVRSRIRDTPALTPTSREGDRVRIIGIVREPESLAKAPLTGRTGVIARTRAWVARDRHDVSSVPWETFAMVPFTVETKDHGVVQIDSRYALLSVRPLSLRDVPYERRLGFLSEHAASTRGVRLPCEEVVVSPGTRVSLVGSLERVVATEPSTAERGFRDSEPIRLRLRGTLNAPVLLAETRAV